MWQEESGSKIGGRDAPIDGRGGDGVACRASGAGAVGSRPFDAAAGRFKVVFAEQRAEGFAVWENPFTVLRFPKLIDLFQDPFERAEHESIGYGLWRAERMFALAPAQAIVGRFLETFKEYPPRQAPGSFTIYKVLETLQSGGTGSN
ncbi:MAG: hypothetical protein GY798_32785 [Hyphomicrobiales bacterium]|nr:hypothetical protein [Hyphomicrobiales bacterium]